MPSPFPGMNPWLEQASVWPDFHNRYLVQLSHRIVPQVWPRYLVRLETRLHIQEQSLTDARFFALADVGLSITDERVGVAPTPPATDAPAVVLDLPNYEVIRETYLTIVDAQRRRVITVVELLSPTNKTSGTPRSAYLFKRRQILNSDTHLVELDFLRGGVRMDEPTLPTSAYAVVVSRATGFRRAEVWPIALRARLPRLPIPLAGQDADVGVDLQTVLHEVYDSARYAPALYDNPPDVPLESADAAWAQTVLAQLPNEGG